MKPAEEYRASPLQSRLADILDDPAMKRAIEVTLVEVIVRLPEPKEIQSAALNAAKLDGAKMAVEVLLSLGKPAPKPRALPPVHLQPE